MTVRKTLLLLAFLSIPVGVLVAQDSNRVLTNADIINMAKSGIGEQTILLTIQKATTKFDTTPDALIQLKAAGVSDAVLNAMLTASPIPAPTTNLNQQNCSQTLDKVLESIGTPERIAVVSSTRLVGKSIFNRGNGSTTLLVDRVTLWSGSIHMVVQPPGGPASTIVITPDFNYFISGKMTTAAPPAMLRELTSAFRLELIYIAQHRNQYNCVLDGIERIGNVSSLKLRIRSQAVEGEFDVHPSTNRLLRASYPTGPSEQMITDFSDWRQIDGVLVPFSRHVISGAGTTEATLTDYQINPTFEASMFQPPAGQIAASITLKVLQSESVPYTVQTNGGISTACNINGSINTTGTASTYGNTTYGTATSTPNLQMNCRSTDTTIRWNHVLNAMLVQAFDGNAYIIACDRAWRWSKCVPLKAGDTFLAKRGDKGFVVQSINSKAKEQEATYSVLQSKSLHD